MPLKYSWNCQNESTLPETNLAPENWWLEDYSLGMEGLPFLDRGSNNWLVNGPHITCHQGPRDNQGDINAPSQRIAATLSTKLASRLISWYVCCKTSTHWWVKHESRNLLWFPSWKQIQISKSDQHIYIYIYIQMFTIAQKNQRLKLVKVSQQKGRHLLHPTN